MRSFLIMLFSAFFMSCGEASYQTSSPLMDESVTKEVCFDGKTIGTTGDFHREFADRLKLPNSYGANLDALWDVLTGYVGPLSVYWYDYERSAVAMGSDFERIVDVFNEARTQGYPVALNLISNPYVGGVDLVCHQAESESL